METTYEEIVNLNLSLPLENEWAAVYNVQKEKAKNKTKQKIQPTNQTNK